MRKIKHDEYYVRNVFLQIDVLAFKVPFLQVTLNFELK